MDKFFLIVEGEIVAEGSIESMEALNESDYIAGEADIVPAICSGCDHQLQVGDKDLCEACIEFDEAEAEADWKFFDQLLIDSRRW